MNKLLVSTLGLSAALLGACSKAPEPVKAVSPPAIAAPQTPAPLAGASSSAAPATVASKQNAEPAGRDIVKGWKTWRAAACERCHGAAQEGMVGPSLIASLSNLTKEQFTTTVLQGRLERGMPGHPYLADKIDDLYAYLKGRSDGSIPTVRPPQ